MGVRLLGLRFEFFSRQRYGATPMQVIKILLAKLWQICYIQGLNKLETTAKISRKQLTVLAEVHFQLMFDQFIYPKAYLNFTKQSL
jgi:hypothetical protein